MGLSRDPNFPEVALVHGKKRQGEQQVYQLLSLSLVCPHKRPEKGRKQNFQDSLSRFHQIITMMMKGLVHLSFPGHNPGHGLLLEFDTHSTCKTRFVE
uniref:Uncharacterized protein n=1 Tax=Romanomermis culicivorax TaxID=13658 RepID=A0A915HV96_ROMCU